MSGPFSPMTLTCPDCGRRWDGFSIWEGGDVPCDECGRARHGKRMAEANSGRSFSVDSLGGACPTQAQGWTADRRPYYFRARHGEWHLRLGGPGDVDGVSGEVIAAGDDDTSGWMDDSDVLAILDEHLGHKA